MTDKEKIQLIKKITAQYVKTVKEMQKKYLLELHRIQKELDKKEIHALRAGLKKKK